jgi:hypothetical protein
MACRSSEDNLTFLYAGQTTLHSDSFISETVRNRTHVHMNFLLGMTDTVTYQYIDLSRLRRSVTELTKQPT